MTVTAPFFNRLGGLSQDEDNLRARLTYQLERAKVYNARQENYYEGAKIVRDLGIAIPPSLRDLEAVAGWPEIVVDVLDERLDWQGWTSPDGTGDDQGLDAVFTSNQLAVDSGQALLDGLVCGTSFFSVGTGDDTLAEPDPLIVAESPSRCTGTWSPRLRRLTDGLVETYDEWQRLTGWQLYLPNQTITISRNIQAGGDFTVTNRDQHNLNRVPLIMLRNRARSSRTYGRSEITRAIRSITDSGMRTLLGMEVAREFYAAPQRYMMGADEGMFVDQAGNKRSSWDAVIGRLLAIPRDDDGEIPTVGQFPSMSPAPFTEQLKTYSQMISAASGVPSTHLGFSTDNPASADAIREANSRIDKRAVRRQGGFDQGLIELGTVAILWRDGQLPKLGSIATLWTDPSTPTPAAAADRAVKLISVGVLPNDSDVTYEQLGLSAVDIARIKADKRRAAAQAILAGIANAAATLPAPGQQAAIPGSPAPAPGLPNVNSLPAITANE